MNDEIKVYDIEHQSKYGIHIKQVKNIEDAGDHFVTSDELEELGVSGYCYGGYQTFDKKIKEALQELVAGIKKGNKSCIIDDDELLEVLKGCHHPVSHFLDGTRRVGNRLFKHTKKEKTAPQKRDAQILIGYACRILHEDKPWNIEFKFVSKNSYEEVIKIVKKLVTWKEMSTMMSEYNDEEDIKWVKAVWDKPSLFTQKDEE